MQGPSFRVIADCTKQRCIRRDIEFRLKSEQRRKACLRVKVYGKYAIPMECQILGKVRASCGLARASLEICYGDNLEMLVHIPYGKVRACSWSRIPRRYKPP